MITFKELTLDDKMLISDIFHNGQYNNSECTFTNLYMWRKCYRVQWAMVEGFLVIQPTLGEETWVLPPYGGDENADVAKVLQALAEHFEHIGKPFVMKAITEEFKALLETSAPGWLDLAEDRDLADYLYNGEDLRTLKGRKYHGKRNHLNNFMKNYPQAVYEVATKEDIPEIRAFLQWWCQQKKCTLGHLDEGLVCEREAIDVALEAFDDLDFKAAIIRIDGRIEAFTMGEMVNNDTVVIHVEKANGAINGLYGAINQLFLLNEWPDALLINREEDTGDEGLRKAKLSYYPQELITKYEGVYRRATGTIG